MAELRSGLAMLLEEVRAELNRINADLHAARPSTGDVTLPPVVFPGEVLFPPTRYDPRVNPVDPRGPFVNPVDPRGPFVNPGAGPYVYPGYFGGINVQPGGFGTPGINPTLPGGVNPGTVWTSREDPTVGIIGGMQATRITEGTFNGARVELWSTPLGTVITPASSAAAPGQGFVDPRLEMTGRVGAWSADNEVTVTEKFGGAAFNQADLEREFGNTDIGGGLRLKEAIRGIDGAESFATLGDGALGGAGLPPMVPAY